jgi:excisionase family DNA binding protein
MQKLAYSIPGAVLATGIPRTSIYVAIKTGKIVALKHGRRTLIPHDALARFVESLPRLKTGA